VQGSQLQKQCSYSKIQFTARPKAACTPICPLKKRALATVYAFNLGMKSSRRALERECRAHTRYNNPTGALFLSNLTASCRGIRARRRVSLSPASPTRQNQVIWQYFFRAFAVILAGIAGLLIPDEIIRFFN
jgi:hypothetical protein